MLNLEGVPQVSEGTVPEMGRRFSYPDTRYPQRFTPQKQVMSCHLCRARCWEARTISFDGRV